MQKKSKYYKFLKNKTRGWLGEEIIAEVFRRSGYDVIKFGIEHTFYYLKNQLKNNKDETSLRFRHTPDFIILDNKKPFLVEIKTTSLENKLLLKIEDYEALTRYWKDAYLVVLSYNSKPYIKYIRVESLGFHFQSEKLFKEMEEEREYATQRIKNKKFDGISFDFTILKNINTLFNIDIELLEDAIKLIKEIDNIKN